MSSQSSQSDPRVAGIVAAAIRLILGVTAILTLVVACRGHDRDSKPPAIQIINRDNPGQRFDFTANTVKGKTTLFELFSDRCEPCHTMRRVLDYLAPRRPDLVIRIVDIDRPETTGIDFDSPLAKQYKVDSLPTFRIYDEQGALAAEGEDARDKVALWYSQAQMIDRGEQDPGMRDIMKQYESHDGR